MKCIKRAKESKVLPPLVVRVTNEKAAKAVNSGEYVYASKAEWEAAGRH